MITLDVTDKHHGNKMTNEALPASSIDQIIAWLGRIISWCVPAMALLVLIIVILRYGFNTGAIAAQESVQYLHATVFMLGAAVTLGADQHVRVDIFYRGFQSATKGLGQYSRPYYLHFAGVRPDWLGIAGLCAGQLVRSRGLPGAWRTTLCFFA